ncbi:alpha-ketoacid dehydrogenase subunit beta [Microbacterium sp. zg.B48]|uniref:alpha-ketoacid dehydrogenase subunit beta n=1 Tax=Microbacterium sp. zg.B48 TaxID=2969408 RepID=UPI00214CA616|nr:alpha-ketoacid dehydrogenase subunit beta [Microbacterium sp. zg.B48]MCR2764030.1 alpha-ketoacid dehydrogenase subunit beta [Microbacterium sp. zg.B48]
MTATMRADSDGTSRTTQTLSVQQALNRALADELEADPRMLVFGEDVGVLGGVFRVTDGLQARFGPVRVFDTPLAESAILGTAVGLAIAGFRPVPEVQFDGFAYPAFDQIVSQVARYRYRSRGRLPMPITLRVPSYGGIRAPELHGESTEAFWAHVAGLKVVSPSNAHDAYHLLRASIQDPDPVIFLEPKSRYWQKSEVDLARSGGVRGARIVRPGTHLSILSWGAMVDRALRAADIAAEDGVETEVVDLRWLSPIDTATIAESVGRTRRAVVVHEAARTAGLGAEVSARITERLFDRLRAPVQRVTGYDVPTPSGALEDEQIPSVHRILLGMQRVLEYRRG